MAQAEAIQVGEATLELGERTYVMGVINLSSESKNRDTVVQTPEEALAMADRYRSLGVTLIDVGGQSSHYEALTLDPAEETERVVPVIEALSSDGHLVTVDTWKPEVARAAVVAGAVMVNDTGGLTDSAMRRVVADTGVAAVAVHVEASNPQLVGEMEIRPDKAEQIAQRFQGLLPELEEEGIDQVVLDPGVAVSYRGDYQAYSRMQLEVISGIHHLNALGRPILIPIPRKAELHRTVAYISLALEHGADMIRVHDVGIACDLTQLFGRA